VDLIVMGGEARRGWGRRSLVAERVIRRATVPVLVVASGAADSSPAISDVLVALDLSPASKDVLRAAIALTAEAPVRMTVMHTVKALEANDAVQSPARWMVPEYRAHVLEDARRSLEEVVSDTPAGADVRVQLATGSPTRTILEHAAGMNADLVVVGRSRGFKMLGSTALRLLRRNDRALLVIPGAARGSGRAGQPLAA
jgi:nucleotide-binding universal stress UspA family protein